MKALTFQGVERVEHRDVDEPALEDPGDAIVAVRVAGLCGSDLHPYFGREVGLDPGTVMGHEFVGTVTEVGDDVTAFRPGERVVAPFTTNCGSCDACARGLTARCARGELFGWVAGGRGLQGGQAEYVRVPLADTTLVPVPDALDDDALALLGGDILATALYGAELARVEAGDRVGVVGCGPVGLLAVRAALARGAAEVVAFDPVPTRREVARAFGAAESFDPSAGPRDALDAVIEAAGGAAATRTAAAALRPGGRLAALAVHTEPHLALSPTELYDRNLTYASGRCPARRLLPEALALAGREQDLLRSLVSHRLPLEAGPEAYRRFGAREPGWVKVVFEV